MAQRVGSPVSFTKLTRLALGTIVASIAVAVIEGKAWIDEHPQDLPWTELDLDDPLGRYTASKIAALGEDAPQCRALLVTTGTNDRPAP